MTANLEVKAIETLYRGYRFRSRLEARWAVFFDSLRIPFEYEKEGFDLSSGKYLPDFWMPDQKCWVEIKGAEPTDEEEAKAHELAQSTGHNAFVFFGAIPEGNNHWGSDSAFKYFADEGWDNHHRWCQCWACGALGIQFSGESDRLRCCPGVAPGTYTTDDTTALVAAYTAARRARFEHGATPKALP